MEKCFYGRRQELRLSNLHNHQTKEGLSQKTKVLGWEQYTLQAQQQFEFYHNQLVQTNRLLSEAVLRRFICISAQKCLANHGNFYNIKNYVSS